MKRLCAEGCQNSLKRTTGQWIGVERWLTLRASWHRRRLENQEGDENNSSGAGGRGGTPAVLSASWTARTAHGCVQTTRGHSRPPALRIRGNARLGRTATRLARIIIRIRLPKGKQNERLSKGWHLLRCTLHAERRDGGRHVGFILSDLTTNQGTELFPLARRTQASQTPVSPIEWRICL